MKNVLAFGMCKQPLNGWKKIQVLYGTYRGATGLITVSIQHSKTLKCLVNSDRHTRFSVG